MQKKSRLAQAAALMGSKGGHAGRGKAKRRGNADNRAFASGTLGLLADREDLPVLYGFRADNVFWVGLPALRRVLSLL